MGKFWLRIPIIKQDKNYDLLSKQSCEKPSDGMAFWNDATKYASVRRDTSFVDEVAYMMVTLHRTGA